MILESTDRHLAGTVRELGYKPVSLLGSVFAKRFRRKRPKPHLETAISLLGEQSGSYAHFLLDYAVKLRSLDALRSDEREDCKIILRRNRPLFQDQILELLGCDKEQFVGWDGAGSLQVKTLYLGSHSRRDDSLKYGANPRDYEWLCRRMVQNARGAWKGAATPNIFISRRKGRGRHTENEEEVDSFLRQYGFRTIEPGDYTVAEQVDLFRQAKVIVSPEGSGQANMIFADRPTVIEVIPKHRPLSKQSAVIRLMKFRYAAVAGHPVEPKDVKGARGPNIRIDVKELEDVLHKLGIFPELHKTPTDA